MEQIIFEMAGTATISIAVFGIVFCLTQTEFTRVSRSFAAFLAAVAVNNVPTAIVRFLEAMPEVHANQIDFMIALPSSLLFSPLLWSYVCTVTSSTQKRPAHLWRHLCLPVIALFVALIVLVFSQDTLPTLYGDGSFPNTPWPIALILIIFAVQLAVFPQMAFYLFLIMRRLIRHRLRLRDVYASTEEHELRWIYVIGGLGILFWLVHAYILFIAFGNEPAEIPPEFTSAAAIFGFALVATTTLWGLRQRPPLVPDDKPNDTPMNDQDQTHVKLGEKYEKSALSLEASGRISRKLRTAMEKDNLHRDPNLSLWALARHIGASPNYISQTLNEVIGESFFDFVNGYRISEAKILLSTTNDTVLTITYDVGFNARSSFYNSFKRVTGQTPTQYRKMMSGREGMDDVMTVSQDT